MARVPADTHEETRERFRRERRRPQGRRSVHDLQHEDDTGEATFTDGSLHELHAMGVVTTLLGELKSGKEATVYLAEGPEGLVAVKLYRDLAVRSFKNDAVYRDGRWIGDDRAEKAIRQRTATGVNMQQSLWVMHEYAQLWTLWQAGLPVPRPLVGPEPSEYAKTGRAVVMAFVGDEHGPAPRLSDARLTPHEARSAWTQSLDILARFLRLGFAHGDYSTYNLLWHKGRVVVIDFPQVVTRAESRHYDALFERDVRSLCQSFSRHGLREDPAATLREVQRRARSVSGE
ncbi:RIO1 family regulatory kinase/ATPase, partial [Deinococcus pimensis]|uniref:RIO1 family regulatory kinase/ATPase domain-containing protein n=1 Tax=Deinococcus pimensis TaxID=309888 RepID=UPI000A004335